MFGRRAKPPVVRLGGHATVLAVGGSTAQTQQDAVSARVRVRVELDGGGGYEVSTAWSVAIGQLARLKEGLRLRVDVEADRPQAVHPRDGWAHFDVVKAPREPKLRQLADGDNDPPDPTPAG
ncbi:hypothetical protein GCM10023322_58530 [Rugosimonospora acidiphila]|uniref:Uncharacterized protein n=1 Tax=Rugosimonospora acidiphila TaxID=556531 RepID=A0ABP9SG71_9ACTN